MRKEFKKLIEEERTLYLIDKKTQKKMMRSKHKRYYIFMFLYHFRNCQYFRSIRKDKQVSRVIRLFSKCISNYHERKKNVYSYKAGIEIGLDSNIGKCCDIWHSGVVINGNVGDYCVFHGNNTIGNKGIGKEALRPCIGNNVDFGVGSVVIGDVIIADSCNIGAGAVVTKSCDKSGSTIVGVPGRIVKVSEDKEN